MDNEDMAKLIKLQVFIDHALCKSPRTRSTEEPRARRKTPEPVWDRSRAVSSFLRMAVFDTDEYRVMAQRLRKTEGYAMVDFLLQEGLGEKIEDLSLRYGVSPGHFRRLFRKVAGRPPKAEIKQWQLAKAILSVIDGQQNITEIASGHGYSSPSHFSNEVRKALGFSPTQLIGT